jgi:sensor histidine kinase YesM
MNKRWLEILIHILFWILSSWLIIYSFSITYHLVNIVNGVEASDIRHSWELIRFFSIGQFFFAAYFYIQFYLIQGIKNKSNMFVLTAKSLLIALVFYTLYYLFVTLFFEDLTDILWFPSLWYGIFIFYTTIAIGYGFIKVWSKTAKDKQRLEVANKQAELHALRSQLHPHFLFNTMNNLLAMVDQKSNPKLAKSIDTLSGLLRYVVYDTKNEKVPISQEIMFLKNFAALHLLRFEEDEIEYTFVVKGAYDQQLIEPGILLCYIENAFKHGVQPEEKSFITIHVDITHKDQLQFTVKNSIPSFKPAHEKGGFGIASNTNRLKLAYPNKHSLHITETPEYTVELKIETDESNHSG